MTVRLGTGRTLVVRAEGRPGPDVFVQSVRWNGRPVRRPFLAVQDVLAGGELVFDMGPTPSRWGSPGHEEGTEAAADSAAVLPAPYVLEGDVLFEGESAIRLACAERGAVIRATTDGSTPTDATPIHRLPLRVTDTTTIRAIASLGPRWSPVVSVSCFRRPAGRRVELRSEPAPRYGGGGRDALVDGLRGRENFRLGAWQGFQGRDVDAVVDLGRPMRLARLALSCLRDSGSWILFPRSVEFAVSPDGRGYEVVGSVSSDVPAVGGGPEVRELGVSFPPRIARYVRVHAESPGPLPREHPGRGGASWIFADELLVE
jgi:hypothetical protein